MRFDKSPLPYSAQIDLLVSRGLAVPDRARAEHYLRHLNYYRLGAYWLPLEADHATHVFRPGVSFDDVLNLYIFDREFRLLVMDAIERIEVSIRAGWAYHMAHVHGPHCHLDRSLFKSARGWYDRNCSKLEEEVGKSKEVFIRHFRSRYDEPLPPVWALVEVMTFGQLSQWYGNTGRRYDRNAVARQFGLDEVILTSLLHHLTTLRNICAHHGRLWNREFTVTHKVPNRGDQALLETLVSGGDRKIYNTLTLMQFLMNAINPGHHWAVRLVGLIQAHGIDVAAMGFPHDWQSRPLWDVVK